MYVVSKLFCMYVKLENVNGKMIYFLITSQTVTFFKVRCVLFVCVGRDTDANGVLSIKWSELKEKTITRPSLFHAPINIFILCPLHAPDRFA